MNATSLNTLTDVLLERSSSAETLTFISGQDQHQSVSLAELFRKATLRLGQFQEAGFDAGSQLILQISDNALFLEAFWACLLGGITAVPVAAGNTSEQRHKLFRIAAKLDTPGLFSDAQTLARLAVFASEKGLEHAYTALTQRTVPCENDTTLAIEGKVHQARPEDTAFVQFSSGSTSTPKGVVLTHANLIANTQSIIDGCLMDQRDHLLSWMPLTHDMGLIGFHLTPVVCNVSHSLMPTDLFVRRPALWLTESAVQGATILCSPNFGFQHLLKSFKPEKHQGLDLSCVRLMFNGAEPISVSLCERFMQSMAVFNLDADAMLPVYGLAEASLAVTFPSLHHRFSSLTIDRAKLGIGQDIARVDRDSADGVEFVAVGKPVSHVSVQIRNNDGVVLSENKTGVIWISGKNVTSGYYQESELNAEAIDRDGWLNTGDLGFMHAGQLHITGRAKDIIFVSGQNVYPHDLEEIVIQAGLVERGKLVISSQRPDDESEEELVVFILHRTDANDLLETATAVTRLLGEAAGVRVHAVVPVTRIPKTTSGKVQRFLLIEGLQSGKSKALVLHTASASAESGTTTAGPGEGGEVESSTDGAMHTPAAAVSTAERLLQICNAQVADMLVGPVDNLFDLGISSLTLAQIHAAIEDEWPDKVDITDLFDYPTVTELAAFLDSKGSA